MSIHPSRPNESSPADSSEPGRNVIEALLRAIETSTQDAVVVMDHEGKITFWNDAAERMFGHSREEALGQSLHTFMVHAHYHDDFHAGFAEYQRSGEGAAVGYIIETEGLHKEGKEIPVELSVTPVKTEEGWQAVGIMRDVSGRSELDEELREAKEYAEQMNNQLEAAIEHANRLAVEAHVADQAKSEFLANMSHEIRTPMNGVIGMASLLRDTKLDDEQQEYVETIRGSAEALLRIINDILDFSKIEAGKLELETIDFDLVRVVEESSTILASKAQEKGLEFICFIDPAIHSHLRGDPGRLRQVLINLAGNSIKFTQKGEISVKLELEESDGESVKIRFTISDTGIGIPKDRRSTLFDSFSQVDASITRKYGGTGLGLAICKSLSEMMQGEIGVESELGKGSTFWFTAVFEVQPGGRTTALLMPEGVRGQRVLVVDDNDTVQAMMRAYTTAFGLRLDAVSTGDAAQTSLREASRAGDPYKLVFIDGALTSTDVFELARTIKTNPLIEGLGLIMVNDLGDRKDRTLLRERGFLGALSKPVKRAELRNWLLSLHDKEGGGDDESARRFVARDTLMGRYRKKERLLVAEDNIVNQKVAIKILEKLGHRADILGNGREAVEALEKHQYPLVLMDIQMPEMDGFAATGAIRAKEKLLGYRPVIVAMTAHAMDGDRQQCLDGGMDDYVSKPVRKDELEKVLDRWLTVQETGAVSLPADTAPGTVDEAWVGNSRELDLSAAAEDMCLDLEEYAELLSGFIEDAATRLVALADGLRDDDREIIENQAHAIKGSALNLRLNSMGETAAELEKAAKAGEDLSEYQTNGLEEALEQAKAALQRYEEANAPHADAIPPPPMAASNPVDLDEAGPLIQKLLKVVKRRNLTRALSFSEELIDLCGKRGWTELAQVAQEVKKRARQANLSALREMARDLSRFLEDE